MYIRGICGIIRVEEGEGMYNNLTDIVRDLKTGIVEDITVTDALMKDGRGKGWIIRNEDGFFIHGTTHRVKVINNGKANR